MLSKPIILVATDFSAQSDLALKAAESLRKISDGSIHLVHVDRFPGEWDSMSDDMWMGFLTPEHNERMMKFLNTMIEQQVRRCEVTCTHEISYGKPYKVLKELVGKIRADILLIGHNGAGAGHKHLGGVVTKLIASLEVPVLVINKPLEIKKIAGLVDSHLPAPNIFSWSEELSFLFSADLQFISVESRRIDYLETDKKTVLDDMKNSIGLKLDKNSKARVNVSVTDKKSLTEGIVDVLKSEMIDLAVMTRHNKGMLEKFLIGSTTRRVLDLFEGNMLILPSQG